MGETWIILSFSDRSIQVENNKMGRWDSAKGDCDRLIEVKIAEINAKKIVALATDRLIQGDR